MEKRNKKVSINITESEFQVLEWLAKKERRSVSELASLILMDNAILLFNECQPKGEWEVPTYIPNNKTFKA